MEELTIPAWQAKEIEDTLRIVANVLNSHREVTCVDRKIVKSLEFIRNVINKPNERNLMPDEDEDGLINDFPGMAKYVLTTRLKM